MNELQKEQVVERLRDYAYQHAGELVAAGRKYSEIEFHWVSQFHVRVLLNHDPVFETIVVLDEVDHTAYFMEKSKAVVEPIPGFEKWFM